MKDYQQRVVIEKYELDKKIDNLSKFIATNAFFSLTDEARRLMKEQVDKMCEYSDILAARIALF